MPRSTPLLPSPSAPRACQASGTRIGRTRAALLGEMALAGTVLGGMVLVVAVGGGAGRAEEPLYPSQEVLRRLQLDTIACGRDNSQADCARARAGSDPLLDHPRLSGNCKDTLWQIGQDAVVVPQNSFERREELTALASEMVRLCRPLQQPLSSPAQSTPQAKPRSGFGFIQ